MSKSMNPYSMEITTNLKNPRTGEEIISVEKVEEVLKSRKTIAKWMYIIHDEDVYTSENPDDISLIQDPERPWATEGALKAPHIHIAMNFKSSCYSFSQVAEWFGIPAQYVTYLYGDKYSYEKYGTGRGAFSRRAIYFLHEDETSQNRGKHVYEHSKLFASEDIFIYLENYKTDVQKYGAMLKPYEKVLFEITHNGYTPEQCKEEQPAIYAKYLDKIERARKDYLKHLPMPKLRTNILVEGYEGGSGKSLCARAIARALFPDLPDDELFFPVNGEKVSFSGYKGQPVVIWDDFRSIKLLETLGGKGGVFNVFDPHPMHIAQNVKYGEVYLTNSVNIVTNTQNYYDFMNSLVGGYTDKFGNTFKPESPTQAYRRFPYIIKIEENSYDVIVNRGYAEQDQTLFATWDDSLRKVKGNFQKAVMHFESENTNGYRILSGILIEPFIARYRKDLQNFQKNIIEDEQEIINQFLSEGWGCPNGQPEVAYSVTMNESATEASVCINGETEFSIIEISAETPLSLTVTEVERNEVTEEELEQFLQAFQD